MGEFDGLVERNRVVLPRLVALLLVGAVVLTVLGGGLLLSLQGRVAAVTYEMSLDRHIEVTAVDSHCRGTDCTTELVHRRPDGPVHRRIWASGELPPGTTRTVATADTVGGATVPATCCRDDAGFPVAAALLASGLGWMMALRPRRPERADGTFRLNRFGRMQATFVTAPLALAVGLVVLAFDVQTSHAWTFAAIHALPVLITFTVLTWLRWRSYLVVDGDRFEQVSPYRRRAVRIGPSVPVRFRMHNDGAARKVVVGEGWRAFRLTVTLWGSDEVVLRRALFHALVRHRVRGDHSALLRPHDLGVRLWMATGALRGGIRRLS